MADDVSTFLAKEILQQGDVLRTVLQQRPTSVEEIVQCCRMLGITDWVVTGCGDSLFAGMCAEVWFPAAAGIPLRAIHALHFSRFLYKGVNRHSVVFALSYSGNTARVVEAAVAAKSRAATVVAITANADSRLVEIADYWLPNDAVGERSNCRTSSFQAACLLLRMVAVQGAALSGSASLPSPEGLPDAVEELSRDVAVSVRRIVDKLPDGLSFTVIGGGYGYPIAHYGAAKLYEAATIPAHVAELEQFVHCEIFTIGPTSCVVIIAPDGPSYRRAVEVADGLRELRAITIGISDDPAFGEHCTYLVALPDGWDESLLSFLACVPLQYFGLYWALRLGENADLVSNKKVNRPLIERSEQWDADSYRVGRHAASAQ